MKMKIVVSILVLAAIAAAAAVWWNKREKKASAEEKYGVVQASRGDITLTIQSTATVRPQNRLEIKPPISGRIEEVLVQEGDTVKAGQVIVWMSSTDRAALLDAARAHGTNELAHWQDIYKATPLVAPLDGEIISRAMEPGQTATPADAILVMSDQLIVEAQVDETDLAHIRLGQKASVSLDAYPTKTFDAAVSHIAYEAETVDNVTIYKVDVLPEKMPEFVRSGMTANVTFVADTAEGALLVPAEAVHDEGGKKNVYLPSHGDPQKPMHHEVKVGLTDGKNVEIKEGLAPGDRVLIPQIQMPAADAAKSNPFMPFGRGGGSGTKRAGSH